MGLFGYLSELYKPTGVEQHGELLFSTLIEEQLNVHDCHRWRFQPLTQFSWLNVVFFQNSQHFLYV